MLLGGGLGGLGEYWSSLQENEKERAGGRQLDGSERRVLESDVPR